MSTAPLTDVEQARLNAQAAVVLGLRDVHVETVPARPISYAEVTAAHEADQASVEPFSFTGYIADQVGFLKPATFTVRRSRNPERSYEPQFAPVPNPRPRPGGADMVADRDTIVGHRISFDVTTDDGTSEIRLFTTPEAEDSASILTGASRVGLDAERVFIADDRSERRPLMPIYGSQGTVSFIVADMDPGEVAARVRKALEAEFGDALNKNAKVLTRAVANRRVDVYSADGERRPLAVGVLAAEVPMVMAAHSTAVETETHKPSGGLIMGY